MKGLVVLAVATALATGVAVHGGGAAEPVPVAPSYEPKPEVPNGVGDVDHLSPAMARAVDRALALATSEGVELRVTSGWRSRDKQQRLFEQAVAKYGSAAKARRWVLPPDESEHVKGGAVDVGPVAGARWLETNGVRFGLCRRYDNEPWHFERLAAAKGSTCPAREPHA